MDDRLDNILDRVDQLKLFPAAAQRIMALCQRDDAELKDLALAVASDPVLTARLLQAANSPFYGLPKRVATVPRAVQLLGMEGTRSIAFAQAVNALSMQAGPRARSLYDHAMASGAVMLQLAPRLDGVHPPLMFATALVHDLGLQLLFLLDPEATERRLDTFGHGPRFAKEEREALGFDHAQLGAAGLRRWGLPEEQAVLVETHHSPMGRQQRSRVLMQIADAMADGVIEGEEADQLAARGRNHPLSPLLSAPPTAFEAAAQDLGNTWRALAS